MYRQSLEKILVQTIVVTLEKTLVQTIVVTLEKILVQTIVVTGLIFEIVEE